MNSLPRLKLFRADFPQREYDSPHGGGLCCNNRIRQKPGRTSNGPVRQFPSWMSLAMQPRHFIVISVEGGSALPTSKMNPGTTVLLAKATRAARDSLGKSSKSWEKPSWSFPIEHQTSSIQHAFYRRLEPAEMNSRRQFALHWSTEGVDSLWHNAEAAPASSKRTTRKRK
jgi:hypothetical protein